MFLLGLESLSQTDSILILDAHSHHGFPSLTESEINQEMKYLKELDYDVISFALPVDRSKTNNLFERISSEIERINEISSHSNSFKVLESSQELFDNFEKDKISCMFCIEYFHGVFDGNLSNIDKYKNLGIKYITFINSNNDRLFQDNELSEFGKQVIEKMNIADLKIDISHLNEIEMLEVIKYSKKPVIASHSNSRHIASLAYNLSDEVLLALKNSNGMVMVSFNTSGLFIDKNQTQDEFEKLADHVEYLKSIVGINNIGIGTDLQAYGKYVPSGLNTAESFKKIIQSLKLRDFTISEIEQILYKNYMTFIN